MENRLFNNARILSWLKYFSDNAGVDIQHVKLLDITSRNKNLIPTVQSNKTVLVFTDAGHDNLFYSLWDAGLGECEVWYNEGSDPEGPIKHDKVADMIDRPIYASAGMLIINREAKNTYKIGLTNDNFSNGSIRYVSSEVRAVIMNKMHVDSQDDLCIVSGASVAVEAAMIANEGTVIAVEYSASDRATMESNTTRFGLNNVRIVDAVSEENFKDLPVPTLSFLVSSPHLENEIRTLLRLNPKMQFVIYTLDFEVLSALPRLFKECSIGNMEVISVAISKLFPKSSAKQTPAPWIISGSAVG